MGFDLTNKKVNLAAAQLMSVSLFFAQNAIACQCPPEPPLQVAIASSSVIALVEAVRISTKPGNFGDAMQFGDLRVIATWKGELQPVEKFIAGGICGFYFNATDQFLLYGSKGPGGVRTHMCTRTRAYSRAEEDIAGLGNPKWKREGIEFFPRETGGLSIAVKPIKSAFTIFDDVEFRVSIRNGSTGAISLPVRSEEAGNPFSLVVRRNGGWWTTLEAKQLKGWTSSEASLQSRETSTFLVSPRQNPFYAPGQYTVQVVLHHPENGSKRWGGYLFSEPVAFSKMEHVQEK